MRADQEGKLRFRDFIKNALVQKINYKNAHSLKFIKTALL
jgi:hypothetical protein